MYIKGVPWNTNIYGYIWYFPIKRTVSNAFRCSDRKPSFCIESGFEIFETNSSMNNYPKCEGKARQGLKNISKSMEEVWRTMGSWIKKSDYQNLVALEDLPSSWAKLPFPFTYEFFQLFGQPRLFIKASLNGSPAAAILKTQLCLQGKLHRRWAKRHLTLLCLFLPSNTKFKIYLFI